MASISKIRYTNVIYENGNKRYNDELFTCAGHNTAILLENGGGKTVFIQAALQAVLPHTDLGERKAKETFVLDGEAAHIAIEWILSDKPRRYGLTAVTLYMQNNELKSYKYAFSYGVEDKNTIEQLPFTVEEGEGIKRGATRVEMNSYYQKMSKEHLEAKSFATTKEFHTYIEEHFKIIPEEWRSIMVINGGEGSVEAFFDGCKTTADLVEKLLLPTVEQGLVGEGSEAFANTFESQRAHFNKHKQLERSIKESEKIKGAIESYVQDYGVFHQMAKAYALKKEEAKAIWLLIEEKEQRIQTELMQLEEQKKLVDIEKRNLDKEIACFEVLETKGQWDEAKSVYEKENQAFNTLVERQEEKDLKRHLYKLARFQNNMLEARAKIKWYEEQLSLLDEDTEVEDLKEALEENSGKLKGCFASQLDELEKEMRHVSREKENASEKSEALQKERQVLARKLEQLRQDASQMKGKMEHQLKQMNQMVMFIMQATGQEEIEKQAVSWRKRLDSIEENVMTNKKQLRQLEEAHKKLLSELEQAMERRTQVLSQKGQVQIKLSQLEKMQEKVLENLRSSLSMFQNLESLYLKPQQILAALEEQVEIITREKEEALLLERREAQFLENYAGHDFFTAEPLLETWVERWAPQFDFLQTGTAFIDQLSEALNKEKLYEVPKWVSRVIVADGQEEAFRRLVEKHNHQMTYLVEIIKLSEAKKELEDQLGEGLMVYPKRWSEHMRVEQFVLHKKEARKALDEAIVFRKQKEKALHQMEQLLGSVRSFLEEYDHEYYVGLREESSQMHHEELQLSERLASYKEQRLSMGKQMKSIEDQGRKESEEKNRLLVYLEKAQTYLELKEETEKGNEKLQTLQESISKEEVQKAQMDRELEDTKEAFEEAKETLGFLRSQVNRILEDPLYKEVQEERVIASNEEMTYLRSKQEQLKESLSNKQKGRSEVESLLKESQKVYAENAESFRQEKSEKDIKVLEIPKYEERFALEMEKLTEELKHLKIEIEAYDAKVKAAKTDFDKKEQAYQSKQFAYTQRYGELLEHLEMTKELKERLQKGSSELIEREKQLVKQIQNLEKERGVLLEHKQQMDKKDETHGYCHPHIKPAVLEKSMIQEFDYALKVRMTVNELLEALGQLRSDLEKQKQTMEERKMEFKLFCQKEITDSKLRNMALQGIMQKQNYEDLVVWTDNMVERINQTLTILERDLLDQDQQITQFIIHLYAYLKTVASELDEIPKMTRVNTSEGWKNIYEFVIPTWQEETGKEKIRRHIYALLDDMENESYYDETGKEDVQKVKKYIKEQFKLKTLLKVVMGNDVIRIRCRKVSNVSDVSSQKYSWETSNKWSGGEKWSKNMALYLGILNYLAEKKQNIQADEQKVSRAVILDNPFGKASSGHVLEPVFFIAKELGFQIIALTAHSEGDFIRRYFPIVYSCKLRSTADGRTSIFTKEQEIRKAYFMDNDPVALSILGSNQLGLF